MCKEGFGHAPRHKSSAAFVPERDHCGNLDPGLGFNLCEDWRMALPELRVEVLKTKRPRTDRPEVSQCFVGAGHDAAAVTMLSVFATPSPRQPL